MVLEHNIEFSFFFVFPFCSFFYIPENVFLITEKKKLAARDNMV